MAEIKTKPTNANVRDFINSFTETEQRKKDSFELLKTHAGLHRFQTQDVNLSSDSENSTTNPREARQEGDWPLVGFSPRKAALTLYVYGGYPGQKEMLKELGKFKMGKACIYVKKLSDINQDVLKKLIRSSIDYLQARYSAK